MSHDIVELQLSILPAPDLVGYDVFRSLGQQDYNLMEKLGSVSLSDFEAGDFIYNDFNVLEGSEYYYSTRIFNLEGNRSSFSLLQSTTTKLLPPEFFQLTYNEGNSIQIAWER